MKIGTSLISGLAGSLLLTALHETLRHNIEAAPRMDRLGRQALKKILSASGRDIPSKDKLQKIAMGGDIVGNAAYYALVGINPRHALFTGALLGLTAGVGAVALPGKLGLDEENSNATTTTQLLTVGIYLTGGLVAGAVHSLLKRKQSRRKSLAPKPASQHQPGATRVATSAS